MTRQELKDLLTTEREFYFPNATLGTLWSAKHLYKKRYLIWRCLESFRLAQYWSGYARKKGGMLCKVFGKLLQRHYFRLQNYYGALAGVQISPNAQVGRCPEICHGGVVINGTLGEYCILHGNNIIGNKGRGREKETPVIGNRVDLGAGAVVIGEITIADNCKIGANAVVTKDFTTPGSILIGVPAKEISK